MVVIRLARTGKKKQAFYRIVAADSKRPVQAKFIEILGWYNPHSKEVNIKEDLVKDWLKKGAQPSNTAAKLLKNAGIKLPDWVVIKEKSKKPKNEKPAEEKKPEASKEKEAAEESAPETAEQEAEAAPETKEETPEEKPAAEEAASE